MKLFVFSLVAAAAGTAGFIGMYQEWYIPPSKALLITTGILGITCIAAAMQRTGRKNVVSLLLFGLSLFMVQTAGAWIFESWTFETILSASGMMKISMILFGTGALVLNMLYFTSQRAAKKRSTQRTAAQAKEGWILFKRKRAEKTVAIILGESIKAGRE
ncbi:RNA-binding protein [Domibacillus indicus]|uniref:hypothetical protein n=1 Tax=Domibacillus indicus TaxID=1437523 RepID=UPI000617BE86|nr:hypothetical protein [Domibacillus indicus]